MKEFQGVIRIGDRILPLCTVYACDKQAAVGAVATTLATNERRLGFLRLWVEHGYLVYDTAVPVHEQFNVSATPEVYSKDLMHNYFACGITAYHDDIGYLRLEPDLTCEGLYSELDYTPEMRELIKLWCDLNSQPCEADDFDSTLDKFTAFRPFRFLL